MYLSARVDIAKRNNALVYVSIHHNAGGGKGAEVLVHPRASTASIQLANLILEEYKAIGQNSRGVKAMNHYEVRETPMPAVISEFAFLDNNADVQMVNSDEKLRKEAYAIANAIQRWL
jgi:N-acetylmuramoyl-L-alanine amidase